MDTFSQTVIILCRPAHSENIGATCRAMANCGISHLRIVANKSDYDEALIEKVAIHASTIWHNAEFFSPTIAGLQSSIRDCSLIAGTSRRLGKHRKSWGMTPEQFAERADFHQAGRVAVVFGNERTGLSDAELSCCSLLINIPTSPVFPSLNLAHAVHIVCYTLFRARSTQPYGYEPISRERLDSLTDYIVESLSALGLYPHPNAKKPDEFLSSIFARAALSEGEAQQIKKIMQRIRYVKSKPE